MIEALHEFHLDYRPPLDWASLLAFLASRATPGVESVKESAYRRTVAVNRVGGTVEVRCQRHGDSIQVLIPKELENSLPLLERRVERLFDLAVDSAAISKHLGSDPRLASMVSAFPGIRVPGSWDPFEMAVRAILGQVVSVRAATALAGRLVARHGAAIRPGEKNGLTHLFPTADRLADADLDGLGLSGQKVRSIRALARGVAGESLRFDQFSSLEEALGRLQELPGVGPWTAQYIAMRALNEADAFPAGDLILRRAASADPSKALSEKQLTSLSDRWRPYRAYAAMLLWASYVRGMQKSARKPGRAGG